jgi:hypothetical protein
MYALLTRAPLVPLLEPFDLHVLSLPLAFILSQDQTLHSNIFIFHRLTKQREGMILQFKV